MLFSGRTGGRASGPFALNLMALSQTRLRHGLCRTEHTVRYWRGQRHTGMEYNWVEQGGIMLWIGLIGGLIVGLLVMYGVWLLVRSLGDGNGER